jgi:signal transduction histidine kinase
MPDEKLASIAHDLRAPLTALDVATSDLTGLSDDRKRLLLDAIARLRAIADRLAEEARRPSQL